MPRPLPYLLCHVVDRFSPNCLHQLSSTHSRILVPTVAADTNTLYEATSPFCFTRMPSARFFVHHVSIWLFFYLSLRQPALGRSSLRCHSKHSVSVSKFFHQHTHVAQSTTFGSAYPSTASLSPNLSWLLPLQASELISNLVLAVQARSPWLPRDCHYHAHCLGEQGAVDLVSQHLLDCPCY